MVKFYKSPGLIHPFIHPGAMKAGKLIWAISALFIFNLFQGKAQNSSSTWNSAAGTAWLTTGNWTPALYSGLYGVAGANADVATFAATSGGTPIGINMGGAGNGLNLGAISVASTRAAVLNITNSSGTAGTLRLYGASVNGQANTAVRNNATFLLTLQTTNTLNMLLGGTDHKFTIDNTGGITIASLISGTGNLIKDGAGTGVLTLTNAGNSYSGTTTITTGQLRLNPSANATFASQVILNAGTLSTSGITATRTWTSSSTLNLNANSTIALGAGDHSITFANSSAVTWAGSTLTITGWTGTAGSSGTAGKLFFSSATGLAAGQLSKISFSGYAGTPILLPSGELVPPGAGGPTILPSVGSLTGFTYMLGSGPSTSQSFTISASNLTGGGGNITFDASTSPNYEVSVTPPGTGGFAASVTLPYTGTGTLANNTIWVRLKSGLSVATYNSQTIGISGGGASSSITASGNVTAIPYMVLATNNTAVTENMDVMGTAATTTTITTLPVGFRIGNDWNTGFTANTQAGGTTGGNTISAGGAYNFANGINASATDRGLGFLFSGGYGTPRYIVLRFRNSTGVTVRQLDLSFDYEKYRNGQITLTNTFTHGTSPTPATAETAGNQVYTTDGNNNLVNPATTINKSFSLTGLSIADGTDYYFMWTFTGSSPTNSIAVGIDNFSVTPRDQSLLTSVTSLSGFNYTGAGPSSEQSFTISSDNLGANAVLTPPAAYEISLTSGSGFVANPSTISITPVAGLIPGQPRSIFVRLKSGLSGGLYNGQNITLTSGIISKTVTLNGGVVPEVNLSVTANAGTEAGTTVITVTATASSAVSGDQTMTVGVTGTGITAGDYSLSGAALSGSTLTILNGATTGVFTFTVVNDNLNEGLETAVVAISLPSGGIIIGTTPSQSIAITDDDDAIQLLSLGNPNPTIDFNDLANTGTTSLTTKGTYMLEVGLNANTTYTANDGSSNSGNTYSFGTGTNVDRALGSLASSGINPAYFGFRLTNTTGSSMNALDLDYWGEQWRNGGNTSPDILYFEYSTDATSLSTGTWNTVNTLNFTSLQNTVTIAALDGNNPANRANITGTLGLGNIANNVSFWIRWKDINAGGNDHSLGIDDVILTPRVITPVIYYSKSTGDLDVLGTWGDNIDGSGNNPTNFTANGQVFNIFNRKLTPGTIGANWTISGTLSRAVLGRTNTDTSSFIVPAGFSFNGKIDTVANLCEFTNNSPGSTVTFGNVIHPTSTVTYGATTGNQDITPATYGNLKFVGAGTKNITGALSVVGDVTLDGATMNKSAAGFVDITFSQNINVISPCIYNSGFNTNVSFVTSGNGNQIITGNGNILSCSQLRSLTKTAGSLTLSTSGGSTTVTTQDDIRLLMPTGTSFADNGNTLNVGGDFETDGVAGSYNLTGTLSMNGFPAGAVNIRANVGGATGVALINNLVINSATSNQVNFQPIASGSGVNIIKGDLTIQGASSYSNGIRFGTASGSSYVELRGNYNNTLNANVIFPTAGTLEFKGSGLQTFSTAYVGGDNFFNVNINNSNNVSLVSGNMAIGGTLDCKVGVLTTNANKVVLGPNATLTELGTSNVIGFVESTRSLTNALNTFGGMGFEITNAGPLANITTVLRETGAGANTAAGCSGNSVLRKFTVTPANNSLTNAITVYKYSGTVAELNGQNENFLNLFNSGGTLISNLASLNTVQKSITISNRTAIAGTYVAAVPSPTLTGITLADPFLCTDSTTNVNLAGLLQSGTFTVNYEIAGVAQVSQIVTASVTGTASFTLPNRTAVTAGDLIEVTALTQSGSGCPVASFSQTANLVVNARPTVVIDANDFVCELQTAPLAFVLTGAAPWNINYTFTDASTTSVPVTNQATSPYNTSFSPPFPRLSPTRVYSVKRLVDANGCYAKTADLADITLDVPVPCSITWNGSQGNGNWNDANNWTPNNSAPSNKTSVVIPGGVPQPNINTNSPAPICASITLSGSAQPSVASGFQLNVRGDLSGNGTPYFGGAGKVVLSGTGVQTISGYLRLTNVDFANTSASGVVISPSATLKIEPNGLVTFLGNSRLTNNGNFVLGSSATGTAKIGDIPTTAIINPVGAQFTQERYLPWTNSASGGWYLIGSPMSGGNFTQLADNFYVTGLSTGFGTQGGSIVSSVEPERTSIFAYDETLHNVRTDTVQKQGWRIPASGDGLTVGKGFRAYVNNYSNSSHKFDVKGSLTRNDFVWSGLSRTNLSGCISSPYTFPCDEPNNRGWNLLANPYPCDIDWDQAAGWVKPAAMNNAFYTWNSGLGAYRVYLGTTGTAGVSLGGTTQNVGSPGNIIPSGQGFFVNIVNPGTFGMTVRESAKITSTSGNFARTATAQAEQIRIRLTKDAAADYQYDGMLRMEEGSTDGFEINKDVSNLAGSNFSFALKGAGNSEFLLHSIAPPTETKIIPLVMNYSSQNGVFKFTFSELESITSGTTAYLKDNFTGDMTMIENGGSVEFTVNDASSASSSRFELILSPDAVTGVKLSAKGSAVVIYPNPVSSENFTIATSKLSGKVTVEVLDMLGRKVDSKVIDNISNTAEILMNKPSVAGQYSVKVTDQKGSTVKSLSVK